MPQSVNSSTKMSFTITRGLDHLPSYATLCKLAEQYHFNITGNELTGSFSFRGGEGHYQFDANGMHGTFVAHRVTGRFSLEIGRAIVTVIEKPFWLPEMLLKRKIEDGLNTFWNALAQW
jgi:hypothetical protein